MNISGKLIEKNDIQDITDTFRKREFVIEYAENPQYPEFLKFELIQSNCEQLDPVEVGDEINISFNLKGRKWTDPQGNVKYFNSLQAWRIDKTQDSAQQEAPNNEKSGEDTSWMNESFSEDDDLPF